MDERIREMAEAFEAHQQIKSVIQRCIKAVENMPLHCAYTTFQQSIVECAKNQAIDEIRKEFKGEYNV